jgi:hypothetical protein
MRLSVSILLILFARNVFADGLQYIPKWSMTGDQACYSFDDAKKLVELDSKLQLCVAEETKYPALIDELKLSNQQLQLAIEDADKNYLLQKMEVSTLSSQLITARADLIKAQSTKSVGFGWAIAGALALIIIGGATGFYIAKK